MDGRSKTRVGEPILIHKKGSKVVGLHCNPVQPDLLLSCGNDHFVSPSFTLLHQFFLSMMLPSECDLHFLHYGVIYRLEFGTFVNWWVGLTLPVLLMGEWSTQHTSRRKLETRS